MHELSIAQALVDQVEDVRTSNGGSRVSSVTVRVGTWRLVVPEILTSYYQTLTHNTPLEGSRLEIERVAATAECDGCGKTFAVEENLVVCPDCEAIGARLLTGSELNLISVELED